MPAFRLNLAPLVARFVLRGFVPQVAISLRSRRVAPPIRWAFAIPSFAAPDRGDRLRRTPNKW
jgi:hypothetical protein